MEYIALKFIGAGLAASGMIGAGIGVGTIFGAMLNGVARNPSVEAKLRTNAFIGAALAEALGIFAFTLAMIILFVF